MLAKTLLAVVALAVSTVSAFPSQEIGDVTLFSRGGQDGDQGKGQCKGDMNFCGWEKKCKCPKGWDWDEKRGHCSRPPRPPPKCKKDEKCFCARAQDDWCKFDKNDDRCQDDGKNVIFCAKDKDCDNELKKRCPPPQHCKDKNQHWNPEKKQCECKRGMEERNGKCRFPKQPKPICKEKKNLFCAKDKDNFSKWDDNSELCDDNGFHKTFCCKKEEIKKKCQDAWGN